MAQAALADRMAAVERLTALFKAERMVHLCVTSISLVMLLITAGVIIVRGGGDNTETVTALGMIFGSSGLMTYSASRLLHMWNQALAIISGGAPPSS